jgi:hypothetical protein
MDQPDNKGNASSNGAAGSPDKTRMTNYRKAAEDAIS